MVMGRMVKLPLTPDLWKGMALTRFEPRALLLLSATLLFSFAHEAAAGIITTTGAMTEIFAPVSFIEGDTESSTVILILDEGITILPSEIFVNKVGAGLHSGSSGTPIVISAGSIVQTYIVHFDPTGGFATVTGDVLFEPGEIILGIQTHTPLLDGADGAVGDPAVTYPTGLLEFRAFETLPGIDTVTIAPGSASFTLFAELGIDQARIVTTPIPEPSTSALLILGLAALCVRRRRAGTSPSLLR